MADMHTHVDRKEMSPLFLAAGVTTVLNMGLASPEFVTVTRDEIRRGAVVGPRVFAAFMSRDLLNVVRCWAALVCAPPPPASSAIPHMATGLCRVR